MAKFRKVPETHPFAESIGPILYVEGVHVEGFHVEGFHVQRPGVEHRFRCSCHST